MLLCKSTQANRRIRTKIKSFASHFAIIFAALVPPSAYAQTANELLKKADREADQGNWYMAGPLYAKAEAAFHRSGDVRNELYAKFGRLHRGVDEGAYHTVRDEVVVDLSNPTVQHDPPLRIRALALLGSIDLNLNTAAAKDDWSEIAAIAKTNGDAKWENRAKGELGVIAGINGDVGVAALALYSAISKAEELGDIAAVISFSSVLASGMAVHGLADQALSTLDKAGERAKQSGYAAMPLALSIVKVQALMHVPEQQREDGLTQATKLAAVALAQAEAEGVLGAQAELWNQSGQVAALRKDSTTAEAAFSKAAEVSRAAALPREEAEASLHLSQLYRNTGQPTKASAVIDHGIRAMQRVEESYDLPLFIAEKAEVQKALGSLKAADASFQRATNLVEGLLVNAPSSRVKSSMIGAFGGIYLGHFRLAWNDLHDGPYAFSIIESARGRALLDSIRYSRETSQRRSKETQAEADISRLQRSLIHSALTTEQTKRILDRLDEAYVRLNPVEYARQRAEMTLLRQRPVTVASVQAQLRIGQSLIEYVLDESGSYAIEINREGVKIHSLPPRSQLGGLARTFVTAVRSGSDSRPSGQRLYDAVLAPMVRDGISSLIIVPDGPLHLVPFSALTNRNGEYLNSQLTITSAPSATIYYALSKEPDSTAIRKPFLGIAFNPPAGDTTDPPVATRGVNGLRSANLKPLRFGREEITVAASLFGPQSVTLEGEQGSEAGLKAQPLSEFRVIHLATHGVSDEGEPDRAALVLLPGSEAEDGLWQAREIRTTRLNADVVVLSACETGTGRLQGQEGIMNIARAFLAAGARSVVASLWDVDDRSTATLMEAFYGHLQKGMTVSAALREAQRDFIKDYKEKAKPFLWAGFEVIGNGEKRFNFQNNPQLRSAR